MEVKPNKFWPHLAKIIPMIADAKFVVIDLEMSGINPPSVRRLGSPTMEEVYHRAKEATKTFRTLQLGLTCIVWDEKEGQWFERLAYTECIADCGDAFLAFLVLEIETVKMTSHNYHVSPMFDDQIDRGAESLARMVDRTLSISYDTLMFLKKNCIRMEDVYCEGINYLSRAEEAAIMPRFLTLEAAEGNEVDLENADAETKAFYESVRDQIKRWEDSKDAFADGFLNISNPHGEALNRFQQRLIYQILENDFPGKYRAFARYNTFMQICHKNDEDEVKHRSKTVKKREAALCVQRGLRYILEALVGGDFALNVAKAGSAKRATGQEQAAHLQSAEEKLKHSRPVLVGHNMFLDLCFLYATFFAPLPDTLDEFGRAIHALFPRVTDTKYIATLGEHDMMPAMNLEDLYKKAESDGCTGVFSRANPNGMKPHGGQHHAGHDSYMTAVVFCNEMKERLRGDATGNKADNATADTDALKMLMQWDSSVCKELSNKLRIGNSGTLDLNYD